MIMASIFIIKIFVKFVEGGLQAKLVSDLMQKWRGDLVALYRVVRYTYYLKGSSGHFTNVLNAQVNQSAQFVTQFSTFLSRFLTGIVYILIAFYISPEFSVYALIAGAVVLLGLRRVMARTKLVSRVFSSENSVVNRLMIQLIHNFKYLRGTGRYETIQKQLNISIEKLRSYRLKAGLYSALTQSIQEPAPAIMLIALVYYYVEIIGTPLAPILVTLVLFYRTMNTMMIAQSMWQSALNNVGAMEVLVSEFEAARNNVQSENKTECCIDPAATIEFKNVSFSYGDLEVLSGLNFSIFSNTTVALVGPSGSGKTTIIDLLTKLLVPSKGEILIGATPLERIATEVWQRDIGYVTQDPMVFDDTIANNICLWDGDFNTQDEIAIRVTEAAKMANCISFIERMPKGYKTNIGERGLRLSGGQKQRLAIAREIYKEPSLLILDEATSALDARSETKIQESIDQLKGKMTVVVIAHRLSTIRNVDWVVVMERGRIIEQGRYSDLSRRNSVLRKMLVDQGIH